MRKERFLTSFEMTREAWASWPCRATSLISLQLLVSRAVTSRNTECGSHAARRSRNDPPAKSRSSSRILRSPPDRPPRIPASGRRDDRFARPPNRRHFRYISAASPPGAPLRRRAAGAQSPVTSIAQKRTDAAPEIPPALSRQHGRNAACSRARKRRVSVRRLSDLKPEL